MMRVQQKVLLHAEAMGASLDMDCLDDPGEFLIDAPRGYIWNASDASIICHAAMNFAGDSWWTDAARAAIEDMALGLRLADEQERKSIESDRDEDWSAPEGSPAFIPGAPRAKNRTR